MARAATNRTTPTREVAVRIARRATPLARVNVSPRNQCDGSARESTNQEEEKKEHHRSTDKRFELLVTAV